MKSKVLLVSRCRPRSWPRAAANGSASDPTVLGLTSTNYVTVTQTPTTLPPHDRGRRNGNARARCILKRGRYVIAAGDFPANIAKAYKVKFNDLLAINGWTLAGNQVPEFPAVGTTIKIPAEAGPSRAQ